MICGNCGKPCTSVADATSCCRWKQAWEITVRVPLNDSEGTASVPVDVKDLIAGYARARLADELPDDDDEPDEAP